MKNSKLLTKVLILLVGMQIEVLAMQMQHGFILSNNDTMGSHLVANGHHSRQVEILGQLRIRDNNDLMLYQSKKRNNTHNRVYFLFQSQQLDLPSIKSGMLLSGHIVESRTGFYDPQNKIVKSATFHVQKVLLNVPNPFFAGGGH